MKTVGKTDVYLPLQKVTGIFNMTGNTDFISFRTNFQISKIYIAIVISNKISAGVYEIWQQLVTPELCSHDIDYGF